MRRVQPCSTVRPGTAALPRSALQAVSEHAEVAEGRARESAQAGKEAAGEAKEASRPCASPALRAAPCMLGMLCAASSAAWVKARWKRQSNTLSSLVNGRARLPPVHGPAFSFL